MATMTISLPDPMKDWIETRIKQGEYASASDYVRDLVRRDRGQMERPELTIEDLRRIVDESRLSGVSNKTFDDIIAEGDRIAKARGFFRE
jgi:antitoxin ParD1/3/4